MRARQLQDHLDILPRRVEDLEDRRTNQEVVERRQIDPFGQRVHGHRRAVGRADLHQAEPRPVGLFAHELRIDREEVRLAPRRAEGGERGALGNHDGLGHGVLQERSAGRRGRTAERSGGMRAARRQAAAMFAAAFAAMLAASSAALRPVPLIQPPPSSRSPS